MLPCHLAFSVGKVEVRISCSVPFAVLAAPTVAVGSQMRRMD